MTMKYLSILMIVVFLFGACKKEKYGNTRQKLRVTTDAFSTKLKSSKLKLLRNEQELRYTQFGDFITAITPTSFIGELGVVRFYADTINGGIDAGSFMTLVITDLHAGEEPVLADFTNNATISVIPVINGDVYMNPDGQGASFRENVTFKILWISMELKQVIELPAEYTNIQLNQFYPLFSQKVGNILTTELKPLYEPVSSLSELNNGLTIYFGMTDSTYIEEGSMLGNARGRYIRSSQFKTWTMTPPLPDETKTYISTIGFVNDNIIQIYAGADNIPYTSDDIIVLEPQFWERIYVDVTEN